MNEWKEYLKTFDRHNLSNVDNINKISILYTKLTNDAIIELDHLKYFEDYLLPIYNTDKIHTKEHNFSMLVFINYKIVRKINIFEFLRKYENSFGNLFENVTNYDLKHLNSNEKILYLNFLINCFLNIEEKYVANVCLKLVSILLWSRLSRGKLKELFLENPAIIDKWKMMGRLINDKPDIIKSKPGTFFPTLIQDFLNSLEQRDCDALFYDKFIELIIDLLSQIPTRRFLLPLLEEYHFLEKCRLAGVGKLFQDMVNMMKFYMHYNINEETGSNKSLNVNLTKHHENIKKLQTVSFKLFPDKLNQFYIK